MNINDLRVIDSATGEPRQLTTTEMETFLESGAGQINQQAMQLMAALVMWLAESGYGTRYVSHRPPPIPITTLARAYNALDNSKTAEEWQSAIVDFTIVNVPGLQDRMLQRAFDELTPEDFE